MAGRSCTGLRALIGGVAAAWGLVASPGVASAPVGAAPVGAAPVSAASVGAAPVSAASAGAASVGAANAGAAAPAWRPTWYAAPAPTPNQAVAIDDRTIREIVHVSVGGQRVRITLSNAYGTTPLHVDEAFVAPRAGGATVGAGVRLRFSGADDVTVAPGASVTSDAATLPVAPQSDLAVSLFVAHARASTGHLQQRSAVYYALGDVASQARMSPVGPPKDIWASWLYLSRVEVSGGPPRPLIVAFGDSITDGLGTDPDRASTWPDRLEDRLREAHRDFAVVNAAITGNRLTRPAQWPPFGEPGLARFDRDVLSQPGLAAVVILIGINDIGQSGPGRADYASAAEIEQGLAQLVTRVHAHGARAYLATLTPFRGAKDGYYSDAKDALRQDVNDWIRYRAPADGVVDFDRALDDPAASGRLRPAFDSGDHLHPNSRGAAALAAAVPLAWFR